MTPTKQPGEFKTVGHAIIATACIGMGLCFAFHTPGNIPGMCLEQQEMALSLLLVVGVLLTKLS